MSLGSAVALATERVVTPIEAMHHAIANRWLFAKPVRLVHDAISGFVYGSVRLGGTVAGIGLDAQAAVDPSTADSLQAFVNGLWGDDLGHHEKRLGISMAVRDRGGEPVAIGPGLAAAFPVATGRLVVLVHGLVQTERNWHGTDSGPGLIDTIEAHPALTPVAIRYNSGLRISANGAELAALLESLHSEWPVPVQSIALVGHSMGGLVIRSACVAARAAGHRWIDDVGDVVALASPHRGAPLEKFTNVVARGLGVAAETRPLADLLNRRSGGIKDLRFGTIGADDWKGRDPEALSAGTLPVHPLPGGIDHHFVAGVVTSDPAHPVGVIVGDLMVRAASGTGGSQLDPSNVVVLGGMGHFDLLREPAVIDRVMGWVAPAT